MQEPTTKTKNNTHMAHTEVKKGNVNQKKIITLLSPNNPKGFPNIVLEFSLRL